MSTESPRDNAIIYSSKDMEPVARCLSELICCTLGEIVRKIFSNGENYLRFNIADRYALIGKTVIIICSPHDDRNILELFRIGCGLSELGVGKKIFVMPYIGYSTMERDVLPGEVVTARNLTHMLSSIPRAPRGNFFMFMDLHAAGIRRFMMPDATALEIYAGPLLLARVREEPLGDAVVGSADLGRTSWVEYFAKELHCPMAFVRKSRSFEDTVVRDVVGDVAGKTVVIYDDMVRSGGTAIHAASAYREGGATCVLFVVSHFAVPEGCLEAVLAAPFDMIITTNSHPAVTHPTVAECSRVVVCDVAPLIARHLVGIL
eukprot:gnl/Chilomastix_cuspidata/2868.p1 GENE.gnl/Chilomastix_cuspidata/2868~~gnl/Chilomastix_cuspidata/2868.p1  ORF type:complete len:318 (-),score=112.84 gnl/Chilomastix_cuspidata/2868:49-1002(-)